MAISQSALVLAIDYLAEAEGCNVRVGRQIESGEANCFELHTSLGGHFMLKAMRRPSKGAVAQSEFETLANLDRAVHDCEHIAAPSPVALFADADAYLMDHVPGVSVLELKTLRLSEGERAGVVALIAQGLRRFYDRVGGAYADFHPGNVLYDRGTSSIYLLDPGHPSPNLREPLGWVDYGAPSSDLGYWTYHCVVNDGRHGFRNLRGPDGLANFTAMLIFAAAGELDLPRSGFVREVVSVAGSHADRLAEGRPKQRLLAKISRPWFSLIARRAESAGTGR